VASSQVRRVSTCSAARRGRPEGREEFALELPSDLQVIDAAVSYLVERSRDFAYDGSRLHLNFRVGLTEAIANAILYGNQRRPEKRVRVEVSIDARRIELWVVDEGAGFDPGSVPDPTLPANLEQPGGRGVFLIRKLMDEVEYSERGNAVRLALWREPGPPCDDV
jgi:serine/threonine-protein kinase RsbW